MIDVREIIKISLRSCLPAKWYRQIAFRLKFGRWIDFKNPKTLNEKIMWRKTYGYQKIHSIISDKYAVRQYVADKVGEKHLIPLYQVLENEKNLDFTSLPDSFVAKPTNSSGQIMIVKNKSEISEKKVEKTFKRWLKSSYFLTKEPEYKNIKPRVIIEKLLLDENGNIPIDYKFHCFGGKVEMIGVDIGRFGNHHERNYYSSQWDLLPFIWSAVDKHKNPRFPKGMELNKPELLDEMISIAEKLSIELGYIRVDLYNINGAIYFGELTLTHGGGFALFFPDQYDYYYGNKFDIFNSPE